jgi:hypothetical protein
MNRSVPSSSVVPASARPASVSVVKAALAAGPPRPARRRETGNRPGGSGMSTGLKPTTPRRARASMVARRDAELDGPASAAARGRGALARGCRPGGGAAALSAQENLVILVEEGEVMRPQPIVAEDDVRVAVHVELDEGRRFVEAAQDQPGLDRAADRPESAIRLPHGAVGRRVAAGAGAPAGGRELGRQGKQCDAPESSRRLTRRRPADAASQPCCGISGAG